MISCIRSARIRLLLSALTVSTITLAPAAYGRDAALNSTTDKRVPSLIRDMVGTWNVQQQMWPGPGAKLIALPPAIAHRRLIGDAFLQEWMTLAPGSTQAPFTRVAYFNYNAVNQQYEYFSLDTRAPQMMMEKGRGPGDAVHQQSGITLYGGIFVAPQWGKFKNTAFRYKLVVGKVVKGRQVVRLYLAPLSSSHSEEFLAFQYIYTRINKGGNP